MSYDEEGQPFDIGDQEANVINNVARDQHIAHVQQIIQERRSFLRDVAATRTKARWLVWTGVAIFLIGFGLFAIAIITFMAYVATFPDTGPPPDIFGTPVLGIPSGLWGWVMAAVGTVLIIIGIALHIIATARRKRVDGLFPLPPTAPPADFTGGRA